MRISSQLGSFAMCALSVALLAGCSGSGSSVSGLALQVATGARALQVNALTGRRGVVPPGPMRLMTSARPDAASPMVYVSEASNVGTYSVVALDKEGKEVAQLTNLSGPGGLAGDKAGNVYVANSVVSGDSTIGVYDKTLSTLLATLDDPGFEPKGVAVDGKTGMVAVTNYANAAGGRGDVAIYAKGATTPCTSVADLTWKYFFDVTFDAKGHVYFDGMDSNSNPLLGVITGGCKAYKLTTLAVSGATVRCPYGLQATANGNIAMLDSCNKAVYTFAPPTNGAFGSALTTTPLAGTGTPGNLSLSKGDATLWEADPYHNDVEQFAFPAGGSAIETITPPVGEYVGGLYVNPDSQV